MLRQIRKYFGDFISISPDASRLSGSDKLASLEALRGIAALIVVAYHFLIAFHVDLVGIHHEASAATWLGTPLLALINGNAAVVCFFVLSGYVLAIPMLKMRSTKSLARAVSKRWMRLAGPVLMSTLASWALFASGLYFYETAAEITQSQWLETFGFSNRPQDGGASLADAFHQGLWASFLTGWVDLNTVLWTMRYELLGSFVVFGLAAVLTDVKHLRGILAILAIAFVVAHFEMPFLTCFIVGVGLHYLNLPKLRLSLSAVCVILAVSFYFFGFYKAERWYAAFASFNFLGLSLRIYLNTIAAVGLIAVFASQNFVSRALSGRLALLLGKISFPVYLAHALVIGSFSSWFYVAAMQGGAPSPLLLTALASLLVLAPATWALMLFDDWWVAQSRRVGDYLVPRTHIPTPSFERSLETPGVHGAQIAPTLRMPPTPDPNYAHDRLRRQVRR